VTADDRQDPRGERLEQVPGTLAGAGQRHVDGAPPFLLGRAPLERHRPGQRVGNQLGVGHTDPCR